MEESKEPRTKGATSRINEYLAPWAQARNELPAEGMSLERLRPRLDSMLLAMEEGEPLEALLSPCLSLLRELERPGTDCCLEGKRKMDWVAKIVEDAVGDEEFALAHELSLYAWNVDGNLVPYGLDVLLLDERTRSFDGEPWVESRSRAGDVYFERSVKGHALRAWKTIGGRAGGDLALYDNLRWGRKTLSPSDVLDTLPLSPDYLYLLEQRAALAMILFHGDMDDEELALFARYVRI